MQSAKCKTIVILKGDGEWGKEIMGMKKKEIIERLQQLEALRQAVDNLDRALQALTPEERLVVQMLYIDRQKHGADKLCNILCVEKTSVYRRRDRALKKLGKALAIEN